VTCRNNPASEAGFSLLEAIVACAILALALGAVFGAGRNALKAATGTSRHTEAILEARSLLDRLGADFPLSEGTFEGLSESGRAYRLTVSQVPDARATLKIYDARLELREHRRDTTPIVHLEALKIVEPAP
jgi:general secretion pathway protein I